MTDARRIAAAYVAAGWAPVPIPPRTKSPTIKAWPSFRTTAGEVAEHFAPSANIGVILGDASGGLVDVDLDCPEAVQLAPKVLPPTGAVFGRDGNPRSHWLYVAPGAKTTKVNDKRDSLVELRSTGGQTVFPGSVHPSGEPVRWDTGEPPATVDAAELTAAVKRLGEAARLMRQGFAPELAVALAIEGRVEDPRAHPRRMNAPDGAFKEAVEKYNRDHRQEYPRSGATCPGCGHNGCFGGIPETDPPRWYCFSSGHSAPGLKGQHGYHGDALDLDAHAAGLSRAELLKRDGYLDGPQPVPSPLARGEKRRVKQVVLRRVEELKPPEGWRAHVKQKVITSIAESLPLEGLRQPIVIVPSGHIVHGVHRWAAAVEAGLSEVECVVEDQSQSEEKHRAKVIVENLYRQHLSGDEVNALTRELTKVRAHEIAEKEKPNDINISGQVDQELPAAPRKAGRPKSPKGKAIERVAKETGQTPEAVRQKVKRAEAPLRPAPLQKKPDPTPSPPGLPAELAPDWEALTKVAEDGDRALRQIQAAVTRVIKQADSRPQLGSVLGVLQRWQATAHDLALDMRSSRPVSVCVWCGGKRTGCQPCGGLGLIDQATLDRAPPELRGEKPTAKSILETIDLGVPF